MPPSEFQAPPTSPPDTATILAVDDEPVNLQLLKDILEPRGYEILLARDGAEALEICAHRTPDLILTDLVMPRMDGRQLLSRLRDTETLRHIPVIVISGVDDMNTITACIEAGAEDHLIKPFNTALLQARIHSGLSRKRSRDHERRQQQQLETLNRELEQRVQEKMKELSEAQWATIFALSNLAESRDPETGEHIQRMCEYCKVIALKLARLDKYRDTISELFVDNLYAASPLHDIGKVGIPDNILLKPGKLTAEEFDVMKTHTSIGARTLENVKRRICNNAFIELGIEITLCHHESWNGKGYPAGLQGEAIPLSARILAIGDVYDALTSKRCYKDAFGHMNAVDIILADRGTKFDPDVVDAFEDSIEEFETIQASIRDSE